MSLAILISQFNIEPLVCTTSSAICASTLCFSRSSITGKERDTESGNDYFEARYYSSAMGRFMSPDPLMFNELRLVNPQRWNMYAYAVNK